MMRAMNFSLCRIGISPFISIACAVTFLLSACQGTSLPAGDAGSAEEVNEEPFASDDVVDEGGEPEVEAEAEAGSDSPAGDPLAEDPSAGGGEADSGPGNESGPNPFSVFAVPFKAKAALLAGQLEEEWRIIMGEF